MKEANEYTICESRLDTIDGGLAANEIAAAANDSVGSPAEAGAGAPVECRPSHRIPVLLY